MHTALLSCRDIITYHREYTLEEWLRWWEVQVPYVIRDGLLHEPYAELVRKLRWVVRFVFRAGAMLAPAPFVAAWPASLIWSACPLPCRFLGVLCR